MVYVPTNWQDGVTPVNAVNMNKLEQGLAAAVGIPADVVVTPATAHLIRNRYTAGDTQPSFKLRADGRIEWGPGGSAASDVNLFRDRADVLISDNNFWARKSLGTEGQIYLEATSPTQLVMESYDVAWAGGDWWKLLASGRMEWGGGTGPLDLSLSRLTAGVAALGGALQVNHDWGVWTQGSTPAASAAFSHYVGADSQPRFKIDGLGTHWWGGGGSVAPVTYLAMGSNHQLVTENLMLDDGTLDVNTKTVATQTVFGTWFQNEAAYRFKIDGNGKLAWGSGAAADDTHLYRSGVNALYASGDFAAAGYLIANANLANQVVLAADGRIYFGNALDTNLYRLGANYLGTDDTFAAGGGLNTPGTLNLQGNASYIYSGSSALGYAVIISRALADADNRFTLSNDGHMYFGPGTGGVDVQLWRPGAGQLQTDGLMTARQFTATGSGAGAVAFQTSSLPADGSGYLIISQQTGDSGWRLLINASGHHTWGNGAGLLDTTLYRSGAGQLTTDGMMIVGSRLYAGTDIIVDNANTGAKLFFGPALDTNLYRGAANLLKTDDAFSIVNDSGIFTTGSSTGQYSHRSFVGSEVQPRLLMYANGDIGWGDGVSAPDVFLARSAAGVLTTGGQIRGPGTVGQGLIARAGRISGAGAILAGTGFTVVRNSTGKYTITLSPALASIIAVGGAVVANPTGSSTAFCCTSISTTTIVVELRDNSTSAGALRDYDFSFIVTGT